MNRCLSELLTRRATKQLSRSRPPVALRERSERLFLGCLFLARVVRPGSSSTLLGRPGVAMPADLQWTDRSGTIVEQGKDFAELVGYALANHEGACRPCLRDQRQRDPANLLLSLPAGEWAWTIFRKKISWRSPRPKVILSATMPSGWVCRWCLLTLWL